MFVPHDIEGLDKELYGFLSRYAADMYPDESSEPAEQTPSPQQNRAERKSSELQFCGSEECMCRA